MKGKPQHDREKAIKRYLEGERPSNIAKSIGRSRKWVHKWIKRYESSDDASDWSASLSCTPHNNPRRWADEMVKIVRLIRLGLYNSGEFCGAQVILWRLEELGVEPRPSLRTINRILHREELTNRRTGRYRPKGKDYPKLACDRVNQVHQMDYVGPCYLNGPIRFFSLHCVDLATNRCAINPVRYKAGQNTVDAIWSSWWRLGIPDHVQVDNEAVFYGSRRYPRGMGNLIRLCLLHGVEPWFIPMAEPWRNGVVEKFNGHYRALFLRRVIMQQEQDLRRESLLFEQKHNARYRYSKLKGRTPQAALELSRQTVRFPNTAEAPRSPLARPERGCYHLVRFIRGDAILDVFGERFRLPEDAVYEYAVATVDVERQTLDVTIAGTTIEEYPYRLR